MQQSATTENGRRERRGAQPQAKFGAVAMSKGVAALRTLGLSRTATQEEVKTAFRKLAKKWHPDGHQGSSKVNAEEQFKVVQQAYQLLSAPGGLREAAMSGAASSDGHGTRYGRGTAAGHRDQPPFGKQEWWGNQYGPASRPGYNPHQGYMGFGASGQHYYEDTSAAAQAEDTKRMYRSWFGAAIFCVGLYAVTYTGARDKAAKERGDLVDAWWNQGTRRWEKPLPHMFKDPMLSALIHLKPPNIVHKSTAPGTVKARKQAVTIDGHNVADAYRAREQGHRR